MEKLAQEFDLDPDLDQEKSLRAMPAPRLFDRLRRYRHSTGLICVALTLLITAALLFLSRHILFGIPVYELGDVAANSLSVIRAKEFREIYGPYSQWGFRHPGPALFYVYAAAEWILHDLLRLVPAPLNAHIIANLLLTAFFLAAGIAVFARWSASRCFLALALIIGVLHFGAIGGWVFLSTWTAHPPVLIFVCLLASAASVAAGHVNHLPLLIAAGGFLVHIHVAQAIYVLPIAMLSYVRLLAVQPPLVAEAEPGSRYSWLPPIWRTFPRPHIAAAAILAVFLLPLAIDALQGPRSNLAKILEYQQRHGGSERSFDQSLFFFLQYGTYLSFAPGKSTFDDYSGAEAWRFLRENWRMYFAWLLIWLFPVGCAVTRLLRQQRATTAVAGENERIRLDRFVLGGFAISLVAIGATLAWGMSQQRPMQYYLGDVNHAIYYFCALLFAAVVAQWMERRAARVWQNVLLFVLGFACAHRAAAFVALYPPPDAALVKRSVVEALSRDVSPAKPKFLMFEHEVWPVATAVAVQIVRSGSSFVVSPEWANMFGRQYKWGRRLHGRVGDKIPVWQIRRGATPGSLPLVHGFSMITDVPLPDLDPTSGRIIFAKDGNYRDYAAFGWADSKGKWTATVGELSALRFRPVHAAADVEMVLNVFPLPRERQRLRVFLNDNLIGNYSVTAERQIVAMVPAAAWNEQPEASLRFEYPDATTGRDPRALAFGFRRIEFRLSAPRDPPPAE